MTGHRAVRKMMAGTIQGQSKVAQPLPFARPVQKHPKLLNPQGPEVIFCCGAECGIAGQGSASTNASNFASGPARHWDDFNSRVSLQTGGGKTRGRSLRSYKIDPAGGLADASLLHIWPTDLNPPAGSSGVMTAVSAVMFDVLPNNTSIVLCANTGATNECGGIYYNAATQSLQTFAGNFSAGGIAFGGSVPITTGVWYVLDILVILSRLTSLWTCEAEINAVPVDTATLAKAGTLITRCQFGAGGASAPHSTGTWYVEDMAISLSAADYPIGDSTVVGLFPNGDGVHSMSGSDFAYGGDALTPMTNATTDSWRSMLNPLTIGTDTSIVTSVDPTRYISQIADAVSDYAEWTFDDLPLAQGVNGVTVVMENHNSLKGATDLSAYSAYLDDGGALSAIYALSGVRINLSNNHQFAVVRGFPTTPQGLVGGWTKAMVDALRVRWGYSSDTNPHPILDGVCIEVDYVPLEA